MVRVRALGTAEIDARALRVLPSSARKFALLLRLAVDRGRRVPRSVIRELIFPDLPEKNARHSLRDLVYQFRQAGVAIESDSGGVTLLDEVSSDFGGLIAAVQPTVEQLQAAQDGFLPTYAPSHSEAFSEWLEVFRARVTLDLCRAISRAISRSKTVGDWVMTERAARACLALDPSHEEATLALAETLAVSGSKARAFDLLDEYAKEVGAKQQTLEMPARVVRRRISERISERPQAGLFLPFTGRDVEMLALNERFELARDGQAQCVVITGDAGIGKSRLAEEFCTQAVLKGARVERISTQPHDTHRPMATFADLVPRLLKLPGALGCSPDSMVALRRLTTYADNSTTAAEWGTTKEFAASAIARAIADLLDAISTETTVILFIDDVQWTDELSRDAIASLVSAKIHRRVVLLLTSRDRSVLRTYAQHAEQFFPLSIAPLAMFSLQQMLQALLLDASVASSDNELRDWFANASGGNPFFLRSLVAHYQATGERFSIPSRLSDLLDQQLTCLGTEAFSVLSACVVLGRYADVEHITSTLEIPYIQLDIAIRHLEASHLVASTAQRIEPAHWLVAEAVERLTSPISRRLLHRRVATILEREGRDNRAAAKLWDCAEHWLLAEEFKSATIAMQACADYSIEIGRPREAAEVLLRAAATLPGPDSLALATRAVELADAADESDVVLRGLAFARSLNATVEYAGAELAEILARIGARDDAADVAVRLKTWLSPQNQPVHRIRAATSLVILADMETDPQLATEAFSAVQSERHAGAFASDVARLVFFMIYESRFGNIETSLKLADQLLTLSESLNRVRSADIQRKCGVAFVRSGQLERGVEILCRAFETASECGLLRMQCLVAGMLAGAHLDLGNDDGTDRWLAEWDRLSSQSDDYRTSLPSISLNAEISCTRGDVSSAKTWLQLGRNHAPRTPTARMARWLTAIDAWICQLEYQPSVPDDVVDRLTRFHLAGNEPGDLGDVEIAIGAIALYRDGRIHASHSLIDTYVSEFRRVRGPFARALQEAVFKVDWRGDAVFTPAITRSRTRLGS
jgi:DNA-binding SARP family transcriptional activator/tetratricopeptide (TPR) repeat protein